MKIRSRVQSPARRHARGPFFGRRRGPSAAADRRRPFFRPHPIRNIPVWLDPLNEPPRAVPTLVPEGLESGALGSPPIPEEEPQLESVEQAAPSALAAAALAATSVEHDPHSAINLDLVVPVSGIDLEASAGEKVVFGVYASDKDRQRPAAGGRWTESKGAGPYEIKLTVTGDADFNSAGSGDKEVVRTALRTGNVPLFIKRGWSGTPKIEVKATVKDLAPNPTAPDTGSAKDPDITINWAIKPRARVCPTGLKKISGPAASWVASPATYGYQATPDIGRRGGPDYVRQTVLETFGAATALGFTMSDLKDDWKAANPTLDTPDKVAEAVWGSGDNGTFVFDGNDQIFDLHGGRGNLAPFKESALEDADGIGFKLPQRYECAGTVIGRATIERRITKAKGVEVKKTGP